MELIEVNTQMENDNKILFADTVADIKYLPLYDGVVVQTVSNGVVNIAKVTGDIVITATATPSQKKKKKILYCNKI